MKLCAWCKREMSDEAVVCPHADCGRLQAPGKLVSGPLAPPMIAPGVVPPPMLAPPVAADPSAPPPPPPPIWPPRPGPASPVLPPPIQGTTAGAQDPGAVDLIEDDAPRTGWRRRKKRSAGAGSRRDAFLWLGALAATVLGLLGLALYHRATESVENEEQVAAQAESQASAEKTAAAQADSKNDEADEDEADDEPAAGDSGGTVVLGPRRGRLGVYAMRTLGGRDKWIGEYGGTPESERAVEDGLQWLARHQAADGSWDRSCLDPDRPECRCDKSAPCPGARGGPHATAYSGLALLAFQAGGHYDFNGRRYSDHVRKGLDWLVERQHIDGALVDSKERNGVTRLNRPSMYEHGIAAFALGDACAVAAAEGRRPDERYQRAMEKAVAFIYSMQHDDGGWRYDEHKGEPSDTSVTGWQVLALKSAARAGAPLDDRCVEKVRGYFESRANHDTGQTGYLGPKPNTEATTGVGMLARQFLLNEPDSPMVHKASDYLAGYAERTWPGGQAHGHDTDFYLWYNCTLGMQQGGGPAWDRWNKIVREAILKLQRHEGCAKGSWDPEDRWGNEGGRIYTTALAVLTLEVYYRFASLGK